MNFDILWNLVSWVSKKFWMGRKFWMGPIPRPNMTHMNSCWDSTVKFCDIHMRTIFQANGQDIDPRKFENCFSNYCHIFQGLWVKPIDMFILSYGKRPTNQRHCFDIDGLVDSCGKLLSKSISERGSDDITICNFHQWWKLTLANSSAFWAGRVENWLGQVEFCIEHISDIRFRASA